MIKKITGLIAIFTILSMTSAFAGGTIKGKIDYKNKKWINNTFVYLENVPGKWEPKEEIMDQYEYMFIPKYLPIIVGSTVKFLNSDDTYHNVNSPDHETYDLGVVPKGGVLTYKFDNVGVYTQLCTLHPAMLAFVIVIPNPYYGQSDQEGNFVINDIPKGHYRLITWNERYHADPVEVDVKDKRTVKVNLELHK